MLSSLSKNLAEELAAIAAPFLASGETIASVTPARQRPPFLLRIIPYSELLFYSQYKLFLLVCTSDRVVVLLLKKSIRLTPAVSREFASIPLGQIAEVKSHNGELIIREKNGDLHQFERVFVGDRIDHFAATANHLLNPQQSITSQIQEGVSQGVRSAVQEAILSAVLQAATESKAGVSTASSHPK